MSPRYRINRLAVIFPIAAASRSRSKCGDVVQLRWHTVVVRRTPLHWYVHSCDHQGIKLLSPRCWWRMKTEDGDSSIDIVEKIIEHNKEPVADCEALEYLELSATFRRRRRSLGLLISTKYWKLQAATSCSWICLVSPIHFIGYKYTLKIHDDGSRRHARYSLCIMRACTIKVYKVWGVNLKCKIISISQKIW